MGSFILNAIKPALLDLIQKLQKQLPSYVDKAVGWLVVVIPGSAEAATAWFATTYATVSRWLVVWIPNRKPGVLAKLTKLVGFAKAQVDKV